MRRKEFDMMEEQQEIEAFLKEMSFGFLGMASDSVWPSVVPLNYVFHRGAVYFHGSRIGEKMRYLASDSRVMFAVAKEFAVIPSYFSDPVMACPATSYFKSVMIRGTAVLVEDLSEKAEALEALMVKLQPEGGYKKIDAGDADYIPRIKGVAVVRIDVREVTGKFKFGQNLAEKPRDSVISGLERRGLELDEETAELMRKYCPHSRGL